MLNNTGRVLPIKYDHPSHRIPIIPLTQNDHGYIADPRNNHVNIIQQHQSTYPIQQRPRTPPQPIILKAPTYSTSISITENKHVPQHLPFKKVLSDHIFNGNDHLQMVGVPQPHQSFQQQITQQPDFLQQQSSYQHPQSGYQRQRIVYHQTYLDNQQPQSSYLQQDVKQEPISTTPERPLRLLVKQQQKNKKQSQKPTEIHLSDDEENELSLETSCSSRYLNDTLFSYPQHTKDSCSVHSSDLKHLAFDVMLNDTIIDFYLKYIHHSLVPEERRDRIYIFNTFFFGRLTQAPAHGKTQVTMATRIKRLIDPALDKHLDVRQQLCEYLHLEYADKHEKDGKYFRKESLQVIQPTLIPQQKGYIDCGLFLLHFAELFLVNPPKAITNRASFRCWFHDFQVQHKRDQIQQIIRQIAPHVKPSMFIYQPSPSNNVKKTKKSKRQQSLMEAFPLMGRDRRQSESRVSEIARDPRFSVLYRPRSCDSLIAENKERPLVLQPPTISEMRRYRKIRNPLIDGII
uniref:ULP_PROTEASE domain-containing protein n=1 Tax=Meloidogyne hapla TaxID=6305 RepID=A0A1I8BXX5_MELHA